MKTDCQECPTEEQMRNKQYNYCVIDADIIAYRSAAAVENTIYELYDQDGDLIQEFDSAASCKIHLEEAREFFNIDTSNWVRKSRKVYGDLDDAKKVCDNFCKFIEKTVKAGKYIYYLSGDKNFRKDVASVVEYKHARKSNEKPVHLKAIRQHLINKYGARVTPDCECDDAIACALYQSYERCGVDTDVCLVSIDKDLFGVAGCTYQFIKDEFKCTTELEANIWTGVQALMGDPTDSIPGLPDMPKEIRKQYDLGNYRGVGEKTARKYLEGCNSLQEIYTRILEAYKGHYGETYTYEDWRGNTVTKTYVELADEQLSLVYMMRKKGEIWPDYKKRIRLKTLEEIGLCGP
jgi:hypothetical protein